MKTLDVVLTRRSYLMGIAMIMVILYHSACTGVSHFPLSHGFIGVDIFLFLSGLGLAYSFGRRPTGEFMKRRVVRIFPLFFLWAVVDTLGVSVVKGGVGAWDWFCNLTTLSYYNLGGFNRDWYLQALMLLYLTFPVWFLSVKKVKWGG